jgi:hypothetical protein
MSLTNIALCIAFYAALLVCTSLHRRTIATAAERKTFAILWVGAGSVAFFTNILLAKFGIMEPMPVAYNGLHTALWIGFGFPYMWFGTRDAPFWKVYVIFLTTSFIIKYVEYHLFGTWNGNGFLGLGSGMFWYVLGWSAVDGFLPVLMSLGVKLLGKFVPGMALN